MPKENGTKPRVTREGLIEALQLMLAHLPENALYTLWRMLSYPPALLRRAQIMIINSSESADLFYDACRLDRILRYIDAKHEEGLMNGIQNEEAKKEIRQAVEQLRGRLGMAITILRSRLGDVAQRHQVSLRGLSRLGAFDRIYERAGQKLFNRGPEPQPQAVEPAPAAGEGGAGA